MLLSCLKLLWSLVKWLVIPVCAFFALIGVLLSCYLLGALCQGRRREKGEHRLTRRPNFFRNLFYLFPVQWVRDYFSRPPDYFKYQGCIIFTGRQGSGKTVALVEQTLRYQEEYPLCEVIGNLNYTFQDDELNDWRQLIDYKNGIYGVCVQIDEMQNWFSSNQSKNFPPEMLEVITQNRKNRRVILGTSQCFNRLAKPLREQATEVRKCFTAFGCVTFVHRVEPILNSSGDVEKWKHRGFYYFVHTDKIRNAYDTYHVIESLGKSGFVERSPEVEISVVETSKKRA